MISSVKKTMIVALVLISTGMFAQSPDAPIEMADGMRQSGKIYVVVTVLSIIFTGIIVYLIMLDRKIGKLEKEMKNK